MSHSPPTEASDAGARLDRLPICRFHYRILAWIGSGLFLDSLDIYIQGPLLAYFLSTGWSDIHRNADFLSATFFGLLIGTLASGRLSDLFGRRRLYRANLLLFGAAGVAAACASSPSALIACRLVMGLGLGGEVVVGYGMLTEFVPPAVRGRWAGKLALLSNLGIPVSALLSSAIMPFFGWRPLLAAIAALAGLAWIWQRSMPESPRWYASVGRHGDADRALRSIEEQVERETDSQLPPVYIPRTALRAQPLPKLRMLFQGGLRRRTILAISLMVSVNVSVYTFTAWLPTIFLQRAIPMQRTLLVTWLIQLGSLPGTVAGAWAAETLGRRQSMIAVCFATALAGVAFGLAKNQGAVIACGFLTFLLTYALVTLTFAIYVPEIFPTAVRMTGSSFANACGRTANIFVPQIVPWMLLHLGSSSVFFAIAFLLALQSAAVWLLGENTEHRTLEDIADSFSAHHND